MYNWRVTQHVFMSGGSCALPVKTMAISMNFRDDGKNLQLTQVRPATHNAVLSLKTGVTGAAADTNGHRSIFIVTPRPSLDPAVTHGGTAPVHTGEGD